MKQKQQLLRLAQELILQGIALETARQRCKDLIDTGVPHISEEFIRAAEEFQSIQAKWLSMENQYLTLRDQIIT